MPLNSQTFDYLKELASSSESTTTQAQSALLALGAQATQATDSAQRGSIEDLIIARFQQAGDLDSKQAALEAAGNAGSDRLLPYVRNYLSDSDELIRASAYLALRRIPGEDALQLIRAGQSDPSTGVRNSVILALRLRGDP